MAEQIKVLTAEGVKALFDLLSLQDYPSNDVLMAVINAIDETKADKSYVDSKMQDLELITIDDIDTICSANIIVVDENSEVKF